MTISIILYGQENYESKYRRSSLYSILIKHPKMEFSDAIVSVFDSIPIPDKFNNHNLNKRVINAMVHQRGKTDNLNNSKKTIDNFVEVNAIGRRLLAKWFNRQRDGSFNMEMVAERGYYDANYIDVQVADLSTRGRSILADAGEELIGKTFLLVNDIRYIDKEETAGIIAGALNAVASIAGAGDIIGAVANTGALISDQIAGFKVIVTSYLYQLEWNEEIADNFYRNYYFTKEEIDLAKKEAFNRDKTSFKMKYIGSQTVKSNKTSLKGIHSRNDMIRKVCTRAIDETIIALQRNHEEFRVKVPLFSIEPILVPIGKKEGVNSDSRYEVLEKIENPNGRHHYERVGVIKPVPNKIWDNRYMAIEDEFEGAELKATEFQKVNGKDFYPGMLIREIK